VQRIAAVAASTTHAVPARYPLCVAPGAGA
jgi:hypothetical protein